MIVVKAFIQEYGFTIFYALITAIAAFVGSRIRALYESKIQDDQKRKAVETCVKAVEQLYSTLNGAEKLNAAKSNVIQILDSKGISISEVELDMLIESVVAELNFSDMKIEKKPKLINEEGAEG